MIVTLCKFNFVLLTETHILTAKNNASMLWNYTASRKFSHFPKNIVGINLNNYKDERVLHSNVDNFILKYLSYTLQLLFYTWSNTSKWKFQLKIFITLSKFQQNESWEKQFCKSKFSIVFLLSLCAIIIRNIRTYKWATTGTSGYPVLATYIQRRGGEEVTT